MEMLVDLEKESAFSEKCRGDITKEDHNLETFSLKITLTVSEKLVE